MQLPDGVIDFLQTEFVSRFRPFCLLVDREYRLVDSWGDGQWCGMDGIEPNSDMREVAPFLVGLDLGAAQRLEFIQAPGAAVRVFDSGITVIIDRTGSFKSRVEALDGVERDFTDNPDIRRNFSGRVIRINSDGSIPPDNPWLARATVSAETFAHGFKDPEGAAIHPETGELWLVDHGPQGGDEINVVRPGRDYGWPNVSYGVQYDARQADGRKNVRVGTGLTSLPGVEEPIYFWVPSIAPSGMTFYTGSLFPEWQGNLFIGAMAGRHLVRLILDGERVIAEEQLLEELDTRIREVRQGPDDALYVLSTDSLIRITPDD